jgi:hypothetical protein
MKKMQHASFLVILTMILSAASLFIVQDVAAVGNVEILSSSGYLDAQGYYRVVGEIKNVGDEAVAFVQVTVTYSDSENNNFTTRSNLSMLNVILPGRKSPFEVFLYDISQSSVVESYVLSLTFSPANSKPLGLEITANSSFTDGQGYFHIIGNITNTGTEIAMGLDFAVTYYDDTDWVVAAKSEPLDPEFNYLDPDQTSRFEIVLDEVNRIPLVKKYELTAESVQYAVVPEFSTLTLILAVLLVSAISLAVCKFGIMKLSSRALEQCAGMTVHFSADWFSASALQSSFIRRRSILLLCPQENTIICQRENCISLYERALPSLIV